MPLLKLLGHVRTAMLGTAIVLLMAVATGAALPLLRPPAGELPSGPYAVIAALAFATVVTLAFSVLLSVRVLSGMRPLQGAPVAVTTAVRDACAAARIVPPTCWSTERELERPVVLRGLWQAHVVVSARQADPEAVARVSARELADGAARVTLLACAVTLVLAFWTNLCGYCLAPLSRGSGLPAAGRIALLFAPLALIALVPITALAYVAALATVPLMGRRRARAVVAAFGTQHGHARLRLRERPAASLASVGWAGWAFRSPQGRLEVVGRPADAAPGRAWTRPLELAAGMAGVATVSLAGVVLLAILVSHWVSMGVVERATWPGERAVSATVVSVHHDAGRRGMVASLGGHWTPRVRLDDGRVVGLPDSSHATAAGARLPVAVTAGDARVRSRRQDAAWWLIGAVLFTGALLLATAWAAARLPTFPAAVTACRRAQESAAAHGGTAASPRAPVASALDRVLYRARALVPVWIGGLIAAAALAALTLGPLGSLIGGAFGDAWTGKRIGFLGGTLAYLAGIVWVSLQALVKGWTDDDHRSWLTTRFGTGDDLGGFSATPAA